MKTDLGFGFSVLAKKEMLTYLNVGLIYVEEVSLRRPILVSFNY